MADKKVVKTEDEWRQELSAEEFAVCRQKGTEPAFTGKYDGFKKEGMYHCTCCGTELFSSDTKFDSGSGWPSFFAPVNGDAVRAEEDDSHGMRRVEVLCSTCDSHLGHVFPDGPTPTGQRFCINSVSIKHSDESED